jgi:hypothetical protein
MFLFILLVSDRYATMEVSVSYCFGNISNLSDIKFDFSSIPTLIFVGSVMDSDFQWLFDTVFVRVSCTYLFSFLKWITNRWKFALLLNFYFVGDGEWFKNTISEPFKSTSW